MHITSALSRVCFLIMCPIFMLFGCATPQQPKPIGSPLERLEKKIDVLTKNAALELLDKLSRYTEARKEYLEVIIVDDEEWKSGKWHKMNQELYGTFLNHLSDLNPQFVIIRAFTMYEGITTDHQFGKCRFVCGRYRLPEYRIRLKTKVERGSLRVEIASQREGSPEIGPGVKETIRLESDEAQLASEWLEIRNATEAPQYVGNRENPFENVEEASIFLSKVICCSLPDVTERYGEHVTGGVRVGVGNFMPTGSLSPSPELLKEMRSSLGNKLSQCCPNLTQVAGGKKADEIIQRLEILQSGHYKRDEKLQGPELQTPTVVLQGAISRVKEGHDTYCADVSSYWLLNAVQGLKINELAANACFVARGDVCEILNEKLARIENAVINQEQGHYFLRSRDMRRNRYFLYDITGKGLVLRWQSRVQPFQTARIADGKWIFIASSEALPGAMGNMDVVALTNLIKNYRGSVEIHINCR